MNAYIYEVRDRKTHKLICKGRRTECEKALGMTKYVFKRQYDFNKRGDKDRKYDIKAIGRSGPEDTCDMMAKTDAATQRALHPDWQCDQDRCLECKYDHCIIEAKYCRKIKTNYYVHLNDGIRGREEPAHYTLFHSAN